jgi:hypothetical protein
MVRGGVLLHGVDYYAKDDGANIENIHVLKNPMRLNTQSQEWSEVLDSKNPTEREKRKERA